MVAAPFALHWLADVLHAAGLKVEEVPGWRLRGRGDMGAVRGILCHHTGGSAHGDHPSLGLVLNGRDDLAGPLSQLVLGRDGTFFVLAAGRCNHAGVGEWQGVTAGNASFIGIEAENAGTADDPWPAAQMAAYVRGCAAILAHLGASEMMVAGHREYAQPRGRKIDPLFDMDGFRAEVRRVTTMRPAAIAVPAPIAPDRAMLRRGDEGPSVTLLQRKLQLVEDGVFGAATEAAVRGLQQRLGLEADGLVGPKTWRGIGL